MNDSELKKKRNGRLTKRSYSRFSLPVLEAVDLIWTSFDREDIWCLNIGLRKTTFQHLFGETPKRPAKGKTVDMQYDFTTVSTLIPHPVYAWMAWVRILNPSEESFEQILPLIQEAYEYAQDKYRKRRI